MGSRGVFCGGIVDTCVVGVSMTKWGIHPVGKPDGVDDARCLDMANVGEEGLALQDVEQWRDWVPLGASTGDREGGARGAIDTGTA